MTSSIDWNPDWPAQIGQQHRLAGHRHFQCNSFNNQIVFSFVPNETTVVDNLKYFASSVVGTRLGSAYANLYRPMIVEIFEDGDESTFGYNFTDFRASSVSGTHMWNENLTPASANRIQTKNDGLYIAAQFNNSALSIQFGDSLSSFPLTRHVLQVTPIVRTNANFRLERYDTPSDPYLWSDTVPAYLPSGYADFPIRMGETKVDYGSSAWSIWTPTQLRALGAGGTRRIAVRCLAGGGGAWKLDYVAVRVYWIDNPRVGLGIGTITPGNLVDLNFPLTGGDGSGSFTMTSGQRYTVVLRQISDYNQTIGRGVSVNVRAMNSDAADHPEWATRTMTNYMKATPTVGALGATIPGMICAQFENAGSTVQAAQPYNLIRGAVVGTVGSTDFSAMQSVTITGAATSETYGQVLASIGWKAGATSTVPPSTARIRCEVLNSLGNRVMGPAELTVGDILRQPLEANGITDDAGISYRRVRFMFDEFESLAAGTYTIKFSSQDTFPAKSALYIFCMMATVTVTPDRTMGAGDTVSGSQDFATGFIESGNNYYDLTEAPRSADLGAVLATVPAKIQALTASHGVITTHNAKICPACGNDNGICNDGCGDGALPFSTIQWEEPVSALVDYFDVQRQDDLDPDWLAVAKVDSDTFTWSDYESAIGVQSRYRVRAVDVTGIPGEWSDTASVTVGPYGGDLGMSLSFSSNAAVNMSAIYPETWDGDVERDFTFLEASDVSFGSIYGRNRQVAFIPEEERGMRFSRTLLLGAICTVSIPTMDIFRPLRNLSRAAIPYVCVRDGEGNRWYANLQVTSGKNSRPGELWKVTVTITEVSDRPFVHDTSVPQVEAT